MPADMRQLHRATALDFGEPLSQSKGSLQVQDIATWLATWAMARGAAKSLCQVENWEPDIPGCPSSKHVWQDDHFFISSGYDWTRIYLVDSWLRLLQLPVAVVSHIEHHSWFATTVVDSLSSLLIITFSVINYFWLLPLGCCNHWLAINSDGLLDPEDGIFVATILVRKWLIIILLNTYKTTSYL